MSNITHTDPKPGTDLKTGAPTLARNWASLREEMDRLFDAYLVAPFGRSGWLDKDPFRRLGTIVGRGEGLTPEFDVKETGDKLVITAELAGMDEKDVTVTVRGDLLIIAGEKKAETTEEKAEYLVSERSYGHFTRTVHLPETAELEKVTATYGKGVLTVTVPKRPEAVKEDKKIDITTG
jgi:HSP20 family protein